MKPVKPRKKSDVPSVRVKEAHKIRGLLDLNSADVEELEDLPGVGRDYAKKIVASRPYGRKAELVKKKVLTEETYRRIRGFVAVHGDTEDKN